jgi:Fic family protein
MFSSLPIKTTPKIVDLIQKISFILCNLSRINFRVHSNIHLRKANSIKTIKSSLSIEGNSLSLEQVSDVLNGVKVMAPHKDIVEVKNAIATYEKFDQWDPFSPDDLLKAHQSMMASLVNNVGNFRNVDVGILKGKSVVHVAPLHQNISGLVENLFAYLRESDDNLLIKSCVFHYEFEFIHPFEDGNGRMGRLWQQLILAEQHPIFRVVSIEELLEQRQTEYYESLRSSDLAGSSEIFVEFMLQMMLLALENLKRQNLKMTHSEDRLGYAREFVDNFKRKEYMEILPDISMATASRDLQHGLKEGILESFGSKNQTIYRFRK